VAVDDLRVVWEVAVTVVHRVLEALVQLLW
jgi:hypothetical protein